MKSFKDFISSKNVDTHRKLIPTGIVVHSRDYDSLKKLIPTGIVVHSRNPFKKIKESILEYNINGNPEVDNLHKELSKQYEFDPKEKKEIERYGQDSFDLNAALLGKHHYHIWNARVLPK